MVNGNLFWWALSLLKFSERISITCCRNNWFNLHNWCIEHCNSYTLVRKCRINPLHFGIRAQQIKSETGNKFKIKIFPVVSNLSGKKTFFEASGLGISWLGSDLLKVEVSGVLVSECKGISIVIKLFFMYLKNTGDILNF
jgi:hypothetical protein